MAKTLISATELEECQEHRRSERAIPFVSGEETVLISIKNSCPMIAKILDLSEDGTLVYLSGDAESFADEQTQCALTFYSAGQVFDVEAKIARKSHRLVGFEFVTPPPDVAKRIRTKISEMPDWVKV